MVYANNSNISITEIGKTNPNTNQNNGPQCITDRIPCCRFAGGQVGEWFFPDGMMVPLDALLFYRNSGRDDGTVNLNRVHTNVVSPTGLFCCVVPDATGINQILCADVSELVIGLSLIHI